MRDEKGISKDILIEAVRDGVSKSVKNFVEKANNDFKEMNDKTLKKSGGEKNNVKFALIKSRRQLRVSIKEVVNKKLIWRKMKFL